MATEKTVHGKDALKRKDADVIKHGKGPAVPNEHWQMQVNATPAGIPNDPAGAFLPMAGKNRPQPHVKINECDH
jgi:hypothetical protein